MKHGEREKQTGSGVKVGVRLVMPSRRDALQLCQVTCSVGLWVCVCLLPHFLDVTPHNTETQSVSSRGSEGVDLNKLIQPNMSPDYL